VLGGAAVVGFAAMIGGAVGAGLAFQRRVAGALLALVCTFIIVNWTFVLRVLPSFEAYKPAPGLAATLKEHAAPNDLIVTYNVALPSLVYYLRRHIEVFYDHGPVLDLLASKRPLYLMLTVDDYERAIQPNLTQLLCRVSAQPTFDVKLKNVLSRRRLPEVWLMTNKCDGVTRSSAVFGRPAQSIVSLDRQSSTVDHRLPTVSFRPLSPSPPRIFRRRSRRRGWRGGRPR
jgi:hypothetical protein